MDRATRPGHVSRDRLLGEGSAFARQLARAREEQQQRQQLQQAEQQQDDTDQDTEVEEEEQAKPQLTWEELWDARTTCGYVGTALRQDDLRQLQLQLWWPPDKPKQTSNAPDARSQQYSSFVARMVQRWQQQCTLEQDASTAAYRRVTDVLFGLHPPAQSRRVQRLDTCAAAVGGSVACDWTCCNRTLPAEEAATNHPPQELPVCGTATQGNSVRCLECGASRWDGPEGQLQARLRAVLQTADLDTTSLKQVMRRIAAESGSSSGAGLQLPAAAVKAELAAFLAERDASRPASATAQSNATAMQHRVIRSDACQAGPDRNASQVVVLPGCPAAATSVYTSLVTCFQSKQQQHAVEARVHAAAAAAAVLAPGLMRGVFKRQNKLPDIKPVPGAIKSWVGDVFDHAATAAAAASAGGCSKLQLQAVSRPLPDCTVHQLLDRPSAVLYQALCDTALGLLPPAVGSTHGCALRCLPAVTRSYEDSSTGDVLLREQVSPREWLAHGWSSNSYKQCSMPAAAFNPGMGCEQQSRADYDLIVTECIECDAWDVVVAVRQHIRHILATWCGDSRSSQQPQQQRPRRITRQCSVLDKVSDLKLQGRLLRQRQHVLTAWGAAPAFSLRRVLSSVSKPQHRHAQRWQAGLSKKRAAARSTATRQQQHQQPPQLGRWKKRAAAGAAVDGPSAAAGARHRKDSQQLAEAAAVGGAATVCRKRQQQQQEEQHGESAKQGTKKSRQQQLRQASGAAEQETVQPDESVTGAANSGSSGGGGGGGAAAAAAAAGVVSGKGTNQQAADITSSSSDSSSKTSGDNSSSSTAATSSSSSSSDDANSSHGAASSTGSDSEWADSDAEGRMARARRAKRTGEAAAQQGQGEIQAVFDMALASVDDLMLAPRAVPHSEAFRSRPGGAWQAIGTHQGQQAAARQHHGQIDLNRVRNSLPAGMQLVLQQATDMGISASVLQRTVVRLAALLSRHE